MTRPLQSRLVTAALAAFVVAATPTAARADNPIVQTVYTADPAPLVYNGRLYLYTTHDEDVTVNNFFTMNDWRVYSTTDVVNWVDHGSPLSYRDFTWARGDAWAGQCIYRNGKFYFYVPVVQNSGQTAIGVATSTSPTGPFTDALGRPLAAGGGYIDPSVFIEEDGQAYLYWGNPDLYYVKLNEDMISYQGSPVRVSLTTAGFGTRKDTTRATAYEEGPWFYKRGSLYYIVYPANGIPEDIWYTTSSSPTGPWTYRGVIMRASGASFTNHPGVIDYGGNSYLFYHNGALPGGGGYKRSVAVERFTYGADGTIPTITMTTGGPPGVGNLNPYVTTEAETIAWESGVETEVCSEGGMDVTSINNGDYIKVKGVDFGTGAVSFDARVASASSGGSIELRLDSQTGTLVGTCAVQGTGGNQTWATRSCTVSGATGIHDLFLKFTGGSGALFNFNWWRFTPRDPLPDGGAGGAGGSGTGQGGQSGSSGRGGMGGLGGRGGSATGGASGGSSGGSASGGASGGSSGGSAAGGASAGGRGGSAAGGTTGGSTGPGGVAGGGAGSSGTGGLTGLGGSSVAGTGGGGTGGAGGCSCAVGDGGSSGGLVVLALGLILVRRRGRKRTDAGTQRTC
jgi:arabinoxylan arabinofuranohydrolase